MKRVRIIQYLLASDAVRGQEEKYAQQQQIIHSYWVLTFTTSIKILQFYYFSIRIVGVVDMRNDPNHITYELQLKRESSPIPTRK